MIDLTIFLLALSGYCFLTSFNSQRKCPQNMIGQKVLVKRGNKIIRRGVYLDKYSDQFAICRNGSGSQFFVDINKVFWSTVEWAYVEKV